MADPSGPVIFLRCYGGDTSHVKEHARACRECALAFGLPEPCGVIVDEVDNRPVWMTPEGERFMELAHYHRSVIVYTLLACGRAYSDRVGMARNFLDQGIRLIVAGVGGPIEVTRDILRGMELEQATVLAGHHRMSIKKHQGRPRWGRIRKYVMIDGEREWREQDHQPELRIGRHIIGRIMVGDDAAAIRNWLMVHTHNQGGLRVRGKKWTYTHIRTVLKHMGAEHLIPVFNKTVPNAGSPRRK